MKHLLAIAFITLLALGTACAWVSPSSETASDGIQVHGHWTMTVTNPDGTVDSIQEFSNELSSKGRQYKGADLLTALLAAQTTVDKWGIHIMNLGTNNLEPLSCQESTSTGTGAYLDATFVRDISSGTPLRLTTTCTVVLSDTTAISQIDIVSTMVEVSTGFASYGTIGPGTWPTNNPGVFTEHTIPLADRVDLQHNQVVGLNVVFSFSSPP